MWARRRLGCRLGPWAGHRRECGWATGGQQSADEPELDSRSSGGQLEQCSGWFSGAQLGRHIVGRSCDERLEQRTSGGRLAQRCAGSDAEELARAVHVRASLRILEVVARTDGVDYGDMHHCLHRCTPNDRERR